ncbi:MAG: hypothetical protein LCH88_00110 [Proteobacteria bacterium]|nr:hypothetical protein [Pseudomonadota bacterium]
MSHPAEPRSFEAMELVYEQLAAALDRVGPDDEVLFLTRLAMVMAHRAGAAIDLAACIEAAQGEGARRPVAAS